MPASCAALRSPAKTPVTRCSASIVTLSRKHGPARRAKRRISSKIGLPSLMPKVALGWPTIEAEWLDITVSRPAMPGITPLPPPE